MFSSRIDLIEYQVRLMHVLSCQQAGFCNTVAAGLGVGLGVELGVELGVGLGVGLGV